MAFNDIAVIGGGAWGTALALTCARAGRNVVLWEHDAANAAHLKEKREKSFLPGVRLDDRHRRRGRSGRRRARAGDLVGRAHAGGAQRRHRAGAFARRAHAGRGLRQRHRARQQTIRHRHRRRLRAAGRAGNSSGPSFAADVARGLPTAVTLAARDDTLAAELARRDRLGEFRPYHSTDVRGVEIGGAAKNVLAIAAGVVAGRELGASAAAALTTRGFAELARFGARYGAKAETMMACPASAICCSTCSSTQSRNFSFGAALGRGQRPARNSRRPRRRRLHRARVCSTWRASAASTCRSRPRSRRAPGRADERRRGDRTLADPSARREE